MSMLYFAAVRKLDMPKLAKRLLFVSFLVVFLIFFFVFLNLVVLQKQRTLPIPRARVTPARMGAVYAIIAVAAQGIVPDADFPVFLGERIELKRDSARIILGEAVPDDIEL